VRFVDASALVKRYVRETGSARVQSLLRSDDIAVSRLSAVEVVSAIARLSRDGAIAIPTRDRLVRAYITDLAAWHVVEITAELVDTGQQLLLRHPLRAGDAIQLAAAILLQRALGPDLTAFVAADSRLTTAALAEGLTVELL
jgi:predicted nucleic acid-binding protein